MKRTFYKYQGTGNDFVMIDNRQNIFDKNDTKLIAHLCDRRFGIGADGLILLENDEETDFKMVYFNAYGHQSGMCGNGGRCIVELKMNDVEGIESTEGDFYLETGSPHYVRYKKQDLDTVNLIEEARGVRYNERFKVEGTNVNLVLDAGDHLLVRTYERGVEDETYSCGTGVTAVAIVNHVCSSSGKHYAQKIETKGGNLEVRFFKESDAVYREVWLCGPAEYVYQGELSRI